MTLSRTEHVGGPVAGDALGRRTLQRVSYRLLPLLLFASLVAGIDRFNVGFAALSMNKALGLTSATFALGTSIFFLGFFIFELPSNIILVKVGARRWLARIMVTWGAVVMLMALVRGPASFIALRLLLGVAEAGFAPGALFLLSLWYPERYLARVSSLIVLSVPLSSALSGPLAAAILPLDGALHIPGWKWLFLLEGLPAVLTGVAIWALLSETPEQSRWLAADERGWLHAELGASATPPRVRGFDEFWPALRKGSTWAMALSFLLFGMGLPNLNIWLPTLLKEAGYGVTAIGWISAAPFLASTATMLLVARSSDRLRERTWHAVAPLVVAAVGFAVSATPIPIAPKVVAMSVGYVGLTGALPVFWTLPGRFSSGRALAATIGAVSAIGNLGPFLGGVASGVLKGSGADFSRSGILFAGSAILGAAVIYGLQRTSARGGVKPELAPLPPGEPVNPA